MSILAPEVRVSLVPDIAPVALYGRTWTAVGPDAVIAGVIGDDVRLLLPADRTVLAITGELVVSARPKADGTSTTVFFTSRSTGADVFPAVDVPGQVLVGAPAGQLVFATGLDATSAGDPGVVAISMTDGSIRSVMPGTDTPDGVGPPTGRNILASPSGRTVLTSLCDLAGCSGGEIIDGQTAEVVGQLDVMDGPSAINDDVALVRRGGDVTIEIAVVDLESAADLWRLKADEFAHGYLTDAGDVVVLVAREGAAQLGVIDSAGRARYSDPISGALPSLWTDQSTSTLAVIGEGGPFPGEVGSDGLVRADVFDVSTWTLAPDALRIDLDGQP